MKSLSIYKLKLILLFQVGGLSPNKRNMAGYNFSDACNAFFGLNFKMAAVQPDTARVTFFSWKNIFLFVLGGPYGSLEAFWLVLGHKKATFEQISQKNEVYKFSKTSFPRIGLQIIENI